MRSAHRCIAASLVAGLLLTGPAARAQEALAVPPDEPVAGRTQAQWSQAWWQWAASFDRAESPVADRTGRLCDRKQGGEVWFLAGTYGTRRTVRTCTVPAGRFLFFPLVNYIVMPSLREPITCDEARTRAAELTHGAGALVVDVDGERVTGLLGHRQATAECFDLAALSETGARIYPSAANGYYVMLKPPPPGRHVIHLGGILPNIVQAVTYTLIVE